MRRISRIFLPGAFIATAVLTGWHCLPRLASLALIVRVAKQEGAWARLARLASQKVHVGPLVAIPTRHGPMETRLYRPRRPARRTAILVPGVHMDGINEKRLVSLATELAASGLQVLTVAPPDLANYRITPNSTDMIEDAVLWATTQAELTPDGRIGLMGISFSGGLAIVAAGRPRVLPHIAFVLSFGGHSDLARVLRYLCQGSTDALPSATEARALATGGENISIPKPHDYGGVVTLLNLAERAVPTAQVAPLEQAITLFLQASSIDRLDPAKAGAIFAQAQKLGESMPEPARTLMTYVNHRDVAKLGEAITPLLVDLALPADLSPERSPAPTSPVFLLHGADDSVVPASETLFLARQLRQTTQVRAHASQLITHAEVNRGTAIAEIWRLSGFWQDLMSR